MCLRYIDDFLSSQTLFERINRPDPKIGYY